MEMPPELGKKKSSFKEEYVIAIGKSNKILQRQLHKEEIGENG